MTARRILRSTMLLTLMALGICQPDTYYGVPLGNLISLSHHVKGEVFVVDSQTLFIKGFSYDAREDDAIFWAGTSESPDSTGFHVPNDLSGFNPLPPVVSENIILRLNGKANISSLRWLSLFDITNTKKLGYLIIQNPIQPPQPMKIGSLVNTKHGVSTGDILLLDSGTILIPNFNYDGTGKEPYWLLSKGITPNENGILLQENGRIFPVAESKHRTLTLTLPSGYNVGEYDTLSIWSKTEGEHYGFVDIPRSLNIPPSLNSIQSKGPKMEDFNCEMLNDYLDLEVRWFIREDEIIIYLIGNIAPSDYMGLILSKHHAYSTYDSADAIIAGIDSNGKGFATDYFIRSKGKCKEGRGMCPDSILQSEDNIQLLSAEKNGNLTVIKFKRRLTVEDDVHDQNIYTDGPQAILWAVGPMQSDGLVGKPILESRDNLLLDFGRKPMWNCPPLKKTQLRDADSNTRNARLHCPGDHLFRAQLGVSPRDITKKVWFINALSTPELTIQRGTTYTFIIEGGLNPPNHHPFYITSSPEGGLYKNILEANEEVEITYAGIEKDELTGTIFPTAEGRLCEWSYKDIDPGFFIATLSEEVQQNLHLKCEPGQPGKLIWTPTAETPNKVYYQSFSERNLGGKINIVDFCEETHPHRYLEEITTKGGKPKVNMPSKYDGLEKESESTEYASEVSHPIPKEENFDIEENKKNVKHLNKDHSSEVNDDNYPVKDKIYTNIISLFSDKLNDRIDVGEEQQSSKNETIPVFQVTESLEEILPHDESERSDKYVTSERNIRKSSQSNNVINSHRNADDLASKYPTHSSAETTSVSALGKPFPQGFKPQFEGGFIPLVSNPMKEKEFVQTKEFVTPSHHQNRPHRPFLYNESVPFHGTFKPGVPDFSGFNISNYSQEDTHIIITPINQDNLALLSAPKPKSIPRNFPPLGGVPLHFLQRPNGTPPIPQRIPDLGPRFQLPQPQSSLIGIRNNPFPHLPIKGEPNFAIPEIRGEDIAGVSSQRVYVAVQTTGNEKFNPPNMPEMSILSGYNRNAQNIQQNKMMYPLPFQRRPDFYNEKEIKMRQPNTSPVKLNTPPIHLNNKQHNRQNAKVPLMQSGALTPQANNRPKVPNSNIPVNKFQGSSERTLIPQGTLRHYYTLMHMPQTDKNPQLNIPQKDRFPQLNLPPANRIPQMHVPQIERMPVQSLPPTHNPLPVEKINDGPLSHPQAADKILRLPHPLLNNNEKSAEVFKDTQIYGSNLPKEQRPSPYLEHAEPLDESNKNISPTFTNDKLPVNQGMTTQKLPFNETLGAFVLSTNWENPQSLPEIKFQESPPLENRPNLSNVNEKSVHAEEDVKLNNSDVKTDIFVRTIQNSGNDRVKIFKENDQNLKYGESHTRPASFPQHEKEKNFFEKEFHSFEDLEEDLAPMSDYEHEDNSENNDFVLTSADYTQYNVPFGARLTYPQNGSKIPVKSTTKISSGIPERSQTFLTNNANRNPGGFIRGKTSTIAPTARSSSTTPSTTSTTPVTIVPVEKISSDIFNTKQSSSSENEEKTKNLYYTPPHTSVHVNVQITNSSIYETESSSNVKHIPVIRDSLEGIIETDFHGRKNILKNNSNSSFSSVVLPPKISEDINLPQISNNPPSHDNRTDYSILNHVLTLIGGPPE